MNTLYIASKNEHKIREIKQMLEGLDFEVKSLFDFPELTSPEETGATFLENAHIKARAFKDFLSHHSSPITHYYVLADDSGLSCDGLGGLPGVQSARFAGEKAETKDNNEKLVAEINKQSDFDPSAHFTCAMVLILPDGSEKEIEEICEGAITTIPKGENGFGYDPYFFLEDHGMTMAEISSKEKNKISHRGKALSALLKEIEKAL